MLGTSARLLRLLSLFQGRRYWTGQDLAARLEITPRTLRRDVDKLRSLGYPVHSAAGAEGGYQLGAGSTMPPLLLNDDEAIAVALGLRSNATGNIEGVEEASVSALAKIEQIMPPRLGRRVAALQSAIVMPARTESSVAASLLTTLAGSCRDLQTLRFRYNDRTGTATVRSVEPHRLVNTGRRWYLVAWDTTREAWRTFRVDRIQPKVTAGARFLPREPPAADLAVYVAKGAWASPICRAKVKLLVSAEAIAPRLYPGIGLVEPVDKQTCYLEIGAATWENLAMQILFLGVDFELKDAPELATQIKRLTNRCQQSISRHPERPSCRT